MSLSEQLARVCGGEKDTLGVIIKKLGGAIPDSTKIDAYAAIAESLNIAGSHNHAASQITSGILPLARGGTGQSSLAGLVSQLSGQGLAKIATGSYTGTGTYGSSNPCSLTFPFSPKLVFIQSNNSSGKDFGYLFAIRGMSYAHGWVIMNNYSILPQTITWLSNGMRWHMSSATDGRYQLNNSGESYYYAALG